MRLLPPAAAAALLAATSLARADLLERLPFVPIPEVATDPNSGTTLGFMPVFFLTDEAREVRHIFAPDVNYNRTLGTGGEFRLFNYPTDDAQWYVVAGGSEKIFREVDLDGATGLGRKGRFSLEARLDFERDPSARFFGLGNDAPRHDETNFTAEQLLGDVLLGVNLAPDVQLTLEVRPRRFRMLRGAFRGLPFTAERFPVLAGLDGGTELLNRAIVARDTRDSTNLPTEGTLLAVFAAFADERLGSSVSYTTFGVDARGYMPLERRVTLAGHVGLRWLGAIDSAPFWVLSRLGGRAGGEASALGLPLGTAQTWRGGGTGRYADRNLFAAGAEVRVRVWELDLAGARIVLEPAPFVDVGRVFPRLDGNPLVVGDLHAAGGIGFRAVVRPFVVGYVDVGVAGEGAEVFSGIGYPF